MLQPFLDNQVSKNNQPTLKANNVLPSKEDAIRLVKDAFASATERDIYTGDWLALWMVDSTGVHCETTKLKFD